MRFRCSVPIFSRHWRDAAGNLDVAQLRQRGPSLAVEISVPSDLAAALQANGRPIPPPFSGVGLIDTGASVTSVDESVLVALGLSPTSVVNVATPSAQAVQQPVYACVLAFPGTPLPAIPFNEVIASNLTGLGCSALIGRDILAACLLVYNGPEGVWTLAF